MSKVLSKDTASGPYLYGPGKAELRWSGDTRTYFLATGETTDGAFCLVDEMAARGETAPLHRHPRDLESIYVIEGKLTVFLGGASGQSASAGAFTHIPAGSTHGFRVASETARYLLITTPHHGEFYRAISSPSGPGGARSGQSIDEEMIMEACQAYDIEYIGPLPPEDV